MAEQTGLDERTIRGILSGGNKPHAQTLHRLAEGLGVKVDEFFVDPAQLLYRRFDRQTNPVVAEVLERHGELSTAGPRPISTSSTAGSAPAGLSPSKAR